jgi:ACS family tartrate transporter-like MFS transporter
MTTKEIHMEQVNEQRVMQKIFWRLIPLLMFLFVIAYIDRVNVGFAALTMNKDIGLNAHTYGLGAGIFFLGYLLFEVPSNLIMVKVGARMWIARILFGWGFVACAMAWVHGPTSFLVTRFTLGVAEAGFFPGVILYLTYWFPARYRARVVSRFMLAIPLSVAVGAPVSTVIMQLNGTLGLKGWQWLFFLEGIPAIVATILVLTVLTDNPAQAKWLTSAEKDWLQEQLATDREHIAVNKTESGAARVFASPMVWAFCIMYFASTSSSYGLTLFMPQIIKSVGFTTMQTGFIMVIPYLIGCGGMLGIGWLSDRFKERKWHFIVAMLIVALAFVSAGLLGKTVAALVLLCAANFGVMGSKGPFWPLPSAYLGGAAAAAGIAFINSVGSLGGFFGPYIVGWASERFGNFSSGLYALGAVAFLGALVTVFAVKNRKATPLPEKAKAAAGTR